MIERIGEWINQGINAFFSGMLNDLSEAITSLFASMFDVTLDLMGMDFIRNTIIIIQVFAGGILIVRIAYHSLTTYILYQHGDPNQDPKKILLEIITGASLIGFSPWIATWVFALGTSLAKSISTVVGFDTTGVSFISLVVGSTFTLLIFFLIAAILILLIMLQASIRAVELALLAVMGPVLGVAGLTSDLFSAWWRNLLVISLTQAVQIFMLKGAFTMIGWTNFEMGSPLFLLIGFLWIAFKTPSILKEYAYSTGMGQAAGGAASQAGSLYIMRKALTRV